MRATLTSTLVLFYSLTFATQTATVIPLAAEPHHQLSLHNEYVNVYRVQVAPHDSVVLHRHDFDAISVMLSDAQVTVNTPGKPQIHRTVKTGQIRLQSRGYVHSTTVDGDSAYRNVTVELLLSQERGRNLCSEVIPDKPLSCSASDLAGHRTGNDEPEFESDQTSVSLVRILPHQATAISHPNYPELVVAIDPDLTISADKTNQQESFDSGKIFWIAGGTAPVSIHNNGTIQSQAVVFTFRSH